MKRTLVTILCLLFITQVQAVSELTERDRAWLVGKYTKRGWIVVIKIAEVMYKGARNV